MTHSVRLLMYGFGDEPNPAMDSINVMEELVVDYITEMVISFFSFKKEKWISHI